MTAKILTPKERYGYTIPSAFPKRTRAEDGKNSTKSSPASESNNGSGQHRVNPINGETSGTFSEKGIRLTEEHWKMFLSGLIGGLLIGAIIGTILF